LLNNPRLQLPRGWVALKIRKESPGLKAVLQMMLEGEKGKKLRLKREHLKK